KRQPEKEHADDNAKGFQSLCTALERLGMSATEQRGIFKLLAGVLHLGNVTFSPSEEGRGK
ncbi:unnamed protein product, partial [Discosporangium mesarthrocarpum]